ncbi:O-antigen polymerase [Reinekea sp.]|jgi:hypothetical protein|uniref:O-antigen polymerase n=1 Tax=Reinekea sp. TaxID=1970455 RepID=UPI003988FA79
MLDVIFVLYYITFLFVIVWFAALSGFSLFRFSIPSFVIVAFLIFSYIGILPMYFQWDMNRVLLGVVNKQLIFFILIISSYSIFIVVLTMLILSKISMSSSIDSISKVVLCGPLNLREHILIAILVVVCVFILSKYYFSLESIALISAFEGNSDIARIRSDMTNNYSGKYHWVSLIINNVLPFISFVLFASFIKKPSFFLCFYFIVLFLLTSFGLLSASLKSPFAWFLIGLFLVYVYIKSEMKYPVKITIFLFSVVFALLISNYLMFSNITELPKALKAIFSRLFTGQIANVYFYLDFYPETREYLLGRSFPNPKSIWPFTPVSISVEIMDLVSPKLKAIGVVGSAPTVYWGEVYVNFGFVGLLVSPVFIGILVYLIWYLSFMLPSSPVSVAFAVWAALHYKNLAATGISGFLIDFYAVVMIAIVFLWVLVSGKIKFRRLV